MLGGVCTAWLVLVAPSGAPLDPFASGSGPHAPAGAVHGDLVDPFAASRSRPMGSRAAARGGPDLLDLKDPFAPQATAARRQEVRRRRAPDLADPFARPASRPASRPVAAPDTDAPCPARKASNGATVQRPEGVAPRCRPAGERGRPHLRDPFA